jgi:hypothetical protein
MYGGSDMDNSEQKHEGEDIQNVELQSPINAAILETYDGDLDDLIDWNNKAAEIEQEESQNDMDSVKEEDDIERCLTAEGKEVEWFNVRAESKDVFDEGIEAEAEQTNQDETSVVFDKQSTETEVVKPQSVSGTTEKLYRIDPSDPHYANYEPDMYYEYGIGPEPKRPTKAEMQNGITGLAITALCCSIGGILLMCCGYGLPLAIASIVMGIIILSKKRPFDSNKVMGLIALILSAVELLSVLALIIVETIS